MQYRIALYFRGAKFSRIAILKLIRGISFEACFQQNGYRVDYNEPAHLIIIMLMATMRFVAIMYTRVFGLLLLGKSCHVERSMARSHTLLLC